VPLPSVAGSRTSAAAAEAALSRAGTDRRAVLSAIRDAGLDGLTDEECQERLALTMSANTQRPRRIELFRAGLIVGRGTRKTRSGRDAVTWVDAELLRRSLSGAQLELVG